MWKLCALGFQILEFGVWGVGLGFRVLSLGASRRAMEEVFDKKPSQTCRPEIDKALLPSKPT